MSNESINNEINVGALSEAINEKMDRNLVNADTIGQAILDRKVEVEALLEHNGYAKFTWKEDNKVASLIVQWGYASIPANKTSIAVNLPTAFSTVYSATATHLSNNSSANSYHIVSLARTNTATLTLLGVSGNSVNMATAFLAVGY